MVVQKVSRCCLKEERGPHKGTREQLINEVGIGFGFSFSNKLS